MKWLELSLKAPSEYVEPLSVIFQRYGYGGVAVEQDGGFNPDEGEPEPDHPTATLRSYLPVDATTADRKEQIRVAVDLIARLCDLSPLEERVMEEGEWMEAWKSHFTALQVGRIVVRPTWLEYAAGDGEIVVDMDPGMAFGTGHHPTTHMCLLELERLVTPGARTLDVGTGSGILAIAAAKLGAESVLALDIDPIAIKAARANVRANGLQSAIKVSRRPLASHRATRGSFDIVVANIYTKIILEMASELVAQAAPGGALALSGIMAERAPEVESRLAEEGCSILRTGRDGDWAVIVAQKGRE